MIYFIIILISSLLLFSVHSFYIMNAAVVEQCSAEAMIYLNKFDSNKMHCLNPTWRHVFIFLEYSCFQNRSTRLWTLQTNINKGSNWPQEIYILTGGRGKTIDYSFSTDKLFTLKHSLCNIKRIKLKRIIKKKSCVDFEIQNRSKF